MDPEKLQVFKNARLKGATLLLGFTGWMDSGEVSTATVEGFIRKLGAEVVAQIDPEGFYIQSFPGAMEVTALFRPFTRIEHGLITEFEGPTNTFFCNEENNLVMFLGREPNLNWREFAECIFSVCRRFDVESIYFIGSVAGLVPHTREPRIFCSASDEKVRDMFASYGMKFSNYEGPASFVTYLTARARDHCLKMASLVATVPAYVQGNNPVCIETVTRQVANLLGVHINMDKLRDASDDFEKRLNEIVAEQPELAGNIRRLEESYDNETFDEELGDLKDWLEQKGVSLD